VLHLRIESGLRAALGLSAIKLLAAEHPGEEELVLLIRGAAGERRLALGPLWRYSGSPECLAALQEYGELVEQPYGGG
jgi:hypothetical protein